MNKWEWDLGEVGRLLYAPIFIVIVVFATTAVFDAIIQLRSVHVYWFGLGLSIIGSVLLFIARTFRFRARQSRVSGSEVLIDSSRPYFRWAYNFIIAWILSLILFIVLSKR